MKNNLRPPTSGSDTSGDSPTPIPTYCDLSLRELCEDCRGIPPVVGSRGSRNAAGKPEHVVSLRPSCDTGAAVYSFLPSMLAWTH
jgi:hypothetical protein